MTNKDRAILKQGSARRLRRNGNHAEWQVTLACETNPRTVNIHAMSSACSAIKAALAQREAEQSTLSSDEYHQHLIDTAQVRS